MLTFGRLAIETEIDQSQIARDFGSKDALVSELVGELLSPTTNQDFLDGVDDTVTKILEDGLPLRDLILGLGQINDELTRAENRFHPQMIVWSAASEMPEVARQLRALYGHYEEHHTGAWNDVAAHIEKHGGHVRSGLSSTELTTVLTAITEGLAIRAAVDPDAVPDDLTGRAFLAMIESMVGEEPGELGDRLTSLGL